ncbi:MAG: MBL fold metallo-hydrolase [bacterium]
MEIQFYGANCIAVTYKQTRVVVDDNLKTLGAKSIIKSSDIGLYTSYLTEGDLSNSTARVILKTPGEFEVGKVSIYGIEARAHTDEANEKTATIYKIIAGGINLIVLGHVYPEFTDKQLERMGMVDVLVVPVGGHGYTLDPQGALKAIKQIEPKLIIPSSYEDNSLKYPVPQENLEDALKAMNMQAKETVQKLKLKAGELSDIRELVILEKS